MPLYYCIKCHKVFFFEGKGIAKREWYCPNCMAWRDANLPERDRLDDDIHLKVVPDES